MSFDEPPQTQGLPKKRREEWWKQSRLLSHGTLCVLWTQSGTGAPALLLAAVAQRDPKALSADRPVLGLR